MTSRQNNVRSVYMLFIKYHICVNAKTQLSLKGDKRVMLWTQIWMSTSQNLRFCLCQIHVPMLYQFPAVLYSQKEKNINHDILHRIGGSQKSGKISDMDLRSYQMAALDFWLSENGDFCTVQRLYLMLKKSLVTNSKDGK